MHISTGQEKAKGRTFLLGGWATESGQERE